MKPCPFCRLTKMRDLHCSKEIPLIIAFHRLLNAIESNSFGAVEGGNLEYRRELLKQAWAALNDVSTFTEIGYVLQGPR